MNKPNMDSDTQIAELLGQLKAPEHGPEFWDSLEASMSETKPSRAHREHAGSRLLVAAVLAVSVVGLALVLALTGSRSGGVETIGTVDDVPSINSTGEIEGPFPWMVQGSQTGDRLLLSTPIEPDGHEPCSAIFADEGEVPDVFEIFSLCLLYTSPSPRDQRGSRMPSSA